MRQVLLAFCPPNARSDPNKIPHMLQIATIMFLLSPRTRSVTRTTLPLFLLSKDVLSVRNLQLRSQSFGARKTTYELGRFSHCLLSTTQFHQYKVSAAFLSSLEQPLVQIRCYFKSAFV